MQSHAHGTSPTAPLRGVLRGALCFVRPLQSAGLLQPADAAAACFYAPNANNAFKNNAASGGWTGYSFPVLDAPVGEYQFMRSLVTPSRRPLQLFDGNTAHSTGEQQIQLSVRHGQHGMAPHLDLCAS